MSNTATDSTVSSQNDSSEKQQLSNPKNQNLSQNVQDSAAQAADPTAWNKSPQELNVTNVATDGKSGLYQDQTLPAGLSSEQQTSQQSQDPMHQYMNDLNSILSDSSSLLKDIGNVLTDGGSNPTAGQKQLDLSALNTAQSVLNLDSTVVQNFGNLLNGAGTGSDNPSAGTTASTGTGSDVPPAGTTSTTGTGSDVPPAGTTSTNGTGSDVPPAGTTSTTGTGSDVPPAGTTSTTGTGSDVPPAGTTSTTGTGSDVPPAGTTTTGTGSDVPPAGTTTTGTGSDVPPAGTTTTGTGSDVPPAGTTTTGTGSDVPPAGTPPTGQFSVTNGEIIGPDGKPFVAKGINVLGELSLSQENQVLQDFPGINFIRLATGPAGGEMIGNNDGVPQIQQFINDMTSRGIVVDVEDHNANMTALTGQDLTNETNWYSQIASANINNPYVWFGGMNEPGGDNGAQAAQMSAIYNAVRSPGNNNIAMLEMSGGNGNTNLEADSQDIQNMHNVVVDAHYYDGGGVNYPNGTSDPASALADEIGTAQQVTSADGKIPVVIGEFGDSTNGSNIDQYGPQAVDAVIQAAESGETSGGAAWLMGSPWNNQGDVLADNNGNLTQYGQTVANWIDSGNQASSG